MSRATKGPNARSAFSRPIYWLFPGTLKTTSYAAVEDPRPRLHCRVSRNPDLPSGSLVRSLSDPLHPCRPSCLAARSRTAARRAFGDLEGLLGRSLGRGACPAPRSLSRGGLLGELDPDRRRGPDADCALCGVAA